MIGKSLRSLVVIAVFMGLVYFTPAVLKIHPAFSVTPKTLVSVSSEEANTSQGYWVPIIIGVVVGIVVAAISTTLSFVATQYGLKKERDKNRKEQAESLKVAFWGEINSIRLLLGKPARDVFRAWQEGRTLQRYILDCPKAIFKANAGQLGDLRDSQLVRHLVNFYSYVEVWEAKGKSIQGGDTSPIAFIDYVILLVSILDLSVNLDMRLSKATKHLEGDQPSVIVSEQDAIDRRFTSEALRQLTEARMSLENS